jgi:hypothetical protein
MLSQGAIHHAANEHNITSPHTVAGQREGMSSQGATHHANGIYNTTA